MLSQRIVPHLDAHDISTPDKTQQDIPSFWALEIKSEGSLVAIDCCKIGRGLRISRLPHVVLSVCAPLARVVLKEMVNILPSVAG